MDALGLLALGFRSHGLVSPGALPPVIWCLDVRADPSSPPSPESLIRPGRRARSWSLVMVCDGKPRARSQDRLRASGSFRPWLSIRIGFGRTEDGLRGTGRVLLHAGREVLPTRSSCGRRRRAPPVLSSLRISPRMSGRSWEEAMGHCGTELTKSGRPAMRFQACDKDGRDW